VYRGIKNFNNFGKIHSFNGKTKLDKWKGDSCNALNGSDGTLNPPLIQVNVTPVYIYVPEICRSIQWKYVGSSKFSGISCGQYSLPPLNSVPEEPDAWCFCPMDDPQDCNIHGIWNIGPCVEGTVWHGYAITWIAQYARKLILNLKIRGSAVVD